MTYRLTRFDHVQLAMPAGQEAAARAFYSDLLGLKEVAKPGSLAKRGGVWFVGAGVGVHLGVEADFLPARKAHPCFRVSDLDALAQQLETAGLPVIHDSELPGVQRFYSADPFGNRLEFQQERE
jgi:catechol 2,3-dioxygenase-like lactoylglutathione lyase family enzyme